ncbi:hypothetical protein BCR35DRAFT_65091 [Leucosporidium creatinivorum]|uniref:MYND-type domain-containing protein n=1 Tax=Leucosporidium creatinivorum TaxID=106004 RepID=A0A1Y2FHV8_9BASI|nr:hypothetical protein BCR35DRAFT_65091 [Leucosporidium creatinivorum]
MVVLALPAHNVCNYCGKNSLLHPDISFKRCGACQQAYYCGLPCQKADFKTDRHKGVCRRDDTVAQQTESLASANPSLHAIVPTFNKYLDVIAAPVRIIWRRLAHQNPLPLHRLDLQPSQARPSLPIRPPHHRPTRARLCSRRLQVSPRPESNTTRRRHHDRYGRPFHRQAGGNERRFLRQLRSGSLQRGGLATLPLR